MTAVLPAAPALPPLTPRIHLAGADFCLDCQPTPWAPGDSVATPHDRATVSASLPNGMRFDSALVVDAAGRWTFTAQLFAADGVELAAWRTGGPDYSPDVLSRPRRFHLVRGEGMLILSPRCGGGGN